MGIEGRGRVDVGIDHQWAKRQAIQIAAQLPPSIEEARVILQYVEALVQGFLAEAPGDRGQVIVEFSRAFQPASRSRAASATESS